MANDKAEQSLRRVQQHSDPQNVENDPKKEGAKNKNADQKHKKYNSYDKDKKKTEEEFEEEIHLSNFDVKIQRNDCFVSFFVFTDIKSTDL